MGYIGGQRGAMGGGYAVGGPVHIPLGGGGRTVGGPMTTHGGLCAGNWIWGGIQE